MWDFSINRALGVMAMTAPFIALRMAVYFGIVIAFVAVTGIGAGIGASLGVFGGRDVHVGATFWGGALGFIITAGAIHLAREYLLYTVKAGHLAVMVEALQDRYIPPGRAQIDYALEKVAARYAEPHTLFAVQQSAGSVLASTIGIVQGVGQILPIPGVDQFLGLARAFLRLAVGMIDEATLAYGFKTRATNPWAAAQSAVVLYAQNHKPILRNAAWLTVIGYGLGFVVFLVMLLPAGAVVHLIPGDWSAGGVIFAIVFAWAFYAALIEPFTTACMIEVYFARIEGQEPEPQWEARIGAVSHKFTEMKERAIAWMARSAGGTPSPPTGWGG